MSERELFVASHLRDAARIAFLDQACGADRGFGITNGLPICRLRSSRNGGNSGVRFNLCATKPRSPPVSRGQLEKAGLMEVLRVVREVEPPKPSTKISTADALPSISANRRTEARKLSALVRGEIDWIVMKSLEKDRNRRYETANAFAADVQRHLAGEAVFAAPPSAGYRLKKFLRKNRGPVVAASLLSAALVAGIAGTTWGLLVARRETERVRAEERKVREEQARTQTARDAAAITHSFDLDSLFI